MEKLFIYDLETTGVKPHKNGIHQFSALIKIDGKIVDSFDLRMKPNPKAIIEDEALAVANVTKEDILNYPFDMWTGYNEIIKRVSPYVSKYDKKDKFHLLGFNNRQFDDNFFRGLFEQNGDKYFGSFFWADSLDVMILASDYLRFERGNLENFKLFTVAKYLGIKVEEEKLHDATYDLYLTMQIYDIVKRNKDGK